MLKNLVGEKMFSMFVTTKFNCLTENFITMKKEEINFTIMHKSVSIKCNWTFEENDENGVLTFENPIDGQMHESIEQVLQGWSEQDEEINKEWSELVELGREFCNNDELYYIVNDGESYNLKDYVK
jgi:hypothetical protein